MSFSLVIPAAEWRTVLMIPKESVLQKGRHGLYADIVKAAGAVNNRFGCYSWGGDKVIFYCGSFTKDYIHGRFTSNLHGRIHNYLQNHSLNAASGRTNTNKLVFDSINRALEREDVFLRLFTFDVLQINDEMVEFAAFSEDPSLVKAVEQLLICTYRRQEQCAWNRS